MSELKIAYRPMTFADIDAATYVRQEALSSLWRSEGHAVEPWQPGQPPHFAHLLRTDPDGAWVATSNGLVCAFAMGFTRESTWFLAQLFVQPDMHSKGIGQELLRRAIAAGRNAGATVLSVVSSTSPVAQSLYMREGMFGIAICYRASGSVGALTAQPASNEVFEVRDEWKSELDELDRFVYGGARTADHAHYHSDVWAPTEQYAFGLRRGGRVVGYGYCDSDGHVGPLAAYEARDIPHLLRAAGDWLSGRGVEEAFAFVPSASATALSALLGNGWRVGWWTFLKASERFGHLDCYVPGGGLLL